MAARVAGARDSTASAHRWLAATRRVAPAGQSTAINRPWPRRLALGRVRALVAELAPEDAAARGHGERVEALSGRLALAIGFTPDEAEIVALAGRLHDIGAIGVHLNEGDSARSGHQRHPLMGAQLVAPFDVGALAAPMIRHHHERLDGSGYPDGLRGESIPVGARIIAVVDEYDYLTADAAPLSRDEALVHLARRAQWALDGTLIAALADLSLP